MVSFSEYQKHAEYNFLLDTANAVNKAQTLLTCKVAKGISMSFLDFDGVDKNDLGLTGYVSLVPMDLYNTKVCIEYTSVYLGKGKIERTLRVGDLTVNFVRDALLDLREGKVHAGDQKELTY